jgi:peptidoglycan/xylan/chitin deacetylase (PgdA/CDA1 family)
MDEDGSAEMPVILIYHDVAHGVQREAHGRPGPLAAGYKLEPALFREHLDAIERVGAEIGLVTPQRPPPAAALTFDDGGQSALEIAAELEKRGWRGHFFVITDRIGTPGFLDANGVRELARRGHVVGSHSHSHPSYISRLGEVELDYEWTRSREVLADVLGEAPRHAAVPGGDVSDAVSRAVERAGYEILMTSDPVLGEKRAGSLRVLGRFPIWASTSAETAAAYVAGRRWAQTRVALAWRVKRAAKKISPGAYERLRRALGTRD